MSKNFVVGGVVFKGEQGQDIARSKNINYPTVLDKNYMYVGVRVNAV